MFIGHPYNKHIDMLCGFGGFVGSAPALLLMSYIYIYNLIVHSFILVVLMYYILYSRLNIDSHKQNNLYILCVAINYV